MESRLSSGCNNRPGQCALYMDFIAKYVSVMDCFCAMQIHFRTMPGATTEFLEEMSKNAAISRF